MHLLPPQVLAPCRDLYHFNMSSGWGEGVEFSHVLTSKYLTDGMFSLCLLWKKIHDDMHKSSGEPVVTHSKAL